MVYRVSIAKHVLAGLQVLHPDKSQRIIEWIVTRLSERPVSNGRSIVYFPGYLLISHTGWHVLYQVDQDEKHVGVVAIILDRVFAQNEWVDI